MTVPAISDTIKITHNGSDLVKDLGLAIGLLSHRSGDPENVYLVHTKWIEDPLAGFEKLPDTKEQRDAVVHVFDDIWAKKAVGSPLIKMDGSEDKNKWLPVPTKKDAPSSCFYFVPESLEDQVELGLGLQHETKAKSGDFTLTPYAFFPLLAMPFPDGNPFVFGKAEYPVPVGADFVFPDKTLTYAGEDYTGFRVNVDFVVSDPGRTTWAIFMKQTGGEYTSFKPEFDDLTTIVNQLLAFDAVKEWLDKPLLAGNPNTVSLGKILLALELLTKTTAGGQEGDEYLLGTLDSIKDITFPKLFAVALELLDGMQLLKLGEKGKEGLFITSTEGEEGGKDYGFNFVLTDIEMGEKAEGAEGEETEDTDDEEKPAAKEGNKLTLQIGKGYDKDPPEVEPGGDEKEEEDEEEGEEGEEEEESNWTNSEEPLGINLLLVNVVKAKAPDTAPATTFAPRLDLVSVGFDYKSSDDDKPIASGKGVSFTGIEPRAFVSFNIFPEPHVQFGAAVRVDHLELPLDASTGSAKDDKNPVASNMMTSKGGEEAEAGDKTTPAPRTRFSFAAGYTPIAKEGTEQHHLNVFLYNAENERTTETIWWKVQKSFGPIALAKVGLSWDNAPRELGLYLSGGLDLSGLKIELDALSVTMPLGNMEDTKVGLKGMSVYFKGGAVEITGGFLALEGPDGTVQYDGEAAVKTGTFGLSAIGSYASVETELGGIKENHTSLFVFAVLDTPLGGPPVFFVTGLAGGFGYNRELLMPTMDDLPNFPLVQAAMGSETSPLKGVTDPGEALRTMAKYIPPSYGEYWLGVGVKFTSFEVIHSFAMLSVAFGTRFEIDVLGLSAVTMPPVPDSGSEPIGFAELALKVTIAPETGIFGLDAHLTPQSYILSKDCHLTGGFAFYIWSQDNPEGDGEGYHAGDFVISLGGYNPHFKQPDFFPAVTRLGFNWRVNNSPLTIKGGMYFALTSTAVMAGGSLSAVYSSGAVRAWFEVHVDFLLGWKPFYYYIDAGITLGASVTIKIIVTFTISVNIGVQLALWGPSFGGKARVHLSIISFTIRFGSNHPNIQPIPWHEFKTSFLPHPLADAAGEKPEPQPAEESAPVRPENDVDTPTEIKTNTMCSVRPAPEGLVRDLSQDKNNQTGLDWIINPERAAFITQTAIPATSAHFITGNGVLGHPAERSTNLLEKHAVSPAAVDIGPSGIPAADLRSDHRIYFHRLKEGLPDYDFDFQAHGKETPYLGNSPRTTWNKEAALKPSLASANKNPLTVEGTLTGFVIESQLMQPDHTMPVNVAALRYEEAPTKPTFSWSDPLVETVNPDPGQDGAAVLMATINDAAVTKRRAAILANLADNGIPVAKKVRVADLAEAADKVLLHAPSLMAWVKRS